MAKGPRSAATAEPKILGRDDILKAKDVRQETVAVPEWGGSVIVETMTARERDLMEQHLVDGRGDDKKIKLENLRAKVVSLTVVNKRGHRLFNTNDDVKLLGAKSAAAMERIFVVACRMNRLTEQDVEQLIKN